MVALFKSLFSTPKKTPISTYILHRAGEMESISTMIFPDEVGYRLLWWKHCGAGPPPPATSIDPSILLGHIQHYAGDALDSICVTSLSYYKEKTSAQHQSLVINIEDYRFNVSNSIRIDRHYPAPVPTPQSSDSEISTSCLAEDDLPTPTKSNCSFVSSTSGLSHSSGNQATWPAVQFHVSGTGKPKPIINRNSKRLATVHFPPTNRPTLAQLLVLARTVSGSQQSAYSSQSHCCQYISTIWEILKLEFKDSVIWPEHHTELGIHTFLPWVNRGKNSQSEETRVEAAQVAEYHLDLAAFMELCAKPRNDALHAREDASRVRGDILRTQEAVLSIREGTSRAREDALSARELEGALRAQLEEGLLAQYEEIIGDSVTYILDDEVVLEGREDALKAEEDEICLKARSMELKELGRTLPLRTPEVFWDAETVYWRSREGYWRGWEEFWRVREDYWRSREALWRNLEALWRRQTRTIELMREVTMRNQIAESKTEK